MRLRFRHLALLTCVGLAGVSACSSDSSQPPAAGIGSGEYKGELSGTNETGVLDVMLSGGNLTPSALRPLDTQDQASAVGTVTLGGGVSLHVTGAFDPDTGALSLVGGGYSFTGTAASDGINGSYSGPHGTGSFSLIKGSGAQVFCGSYVGQDSGVWNLVVGPTSAAGSVASAKGGYASPMACTVSGTSLSCTASSGVTATGSVNGTHATGTWSDGGGHSGTWTGDTTACPVPRAPDAGAVPGDASVDAPSGADAPSANDASGTDATAPLDAGGDASSGSDASAHDAAGTSDASGSDASGSDASGSDATAGDASGGGDSGGGDSGAQDASSADAALVCSAPVCAPNGSSCGCTRSDGVSAYAMQCTSANACFCTVNGVQATPVFAGPFTSCTGGTSAGAAYTMAKYCGCPAAQPEVDAGATDASTADASTSDGGLDCTVPSLAGVTALTVTAHPTTAFPASSAAGGSAVSGTYYSTAVDVYQGGTTPAHTHEILIIDVAHSEAREKDDGGSTDMLLATYVTQGSTITFALACGGTGTQAFGYTATATQIVVYDVANGRVETLVKQ
jgi:hypothetical protein